MSVVGSIMYAMVCTRLDLAYAMSVINRFMSKSGKIHWEVVKWTLRYLKKTINHGLRWELDSEDTVLDSGDGIGAGIIFTMSWTSISWR